MFEILKTADAQRGAIAPTDIAAHPHGAERRAKRAEGVGIIGPSLGHDGR